GALRRSPHESVFVERVSQWLEREPEFAAEIGLVARYAVEVDRFGHACGLRVKNASGESILLPAKSILVAAGTQPNTVLGREDPDHLRLDGRYYEAVDEEGRPVRPEKTAKPQAVRVLTSFMTDGRAISFFGDLHPSFAGNVVKAMASAKQG